MPALGQIGRAKIKNKTIEVCERLLTKGESY